MRYNRKDRYLHNDLKNYKFPYKRKKAGTRIRYSSLVRWILSKKYWNQYQWTNHHVPCELYNIELYVGTRPIHGPPSSIGPIALVNVIGIGPNSFHSFHIHFVLSFSPLLLLLLLLTFDVEREKLTFTITIV